MFIRFIAKYHHLLEKDYCFNSNSSIFAYRKTL